MKVIECYSMYSSMNGYRGTELDECLAVCAFCRVGAGVMSLTLHFLPTSTLNFLLSFFHNFFLSSHILFPILHLTLFVLFQKAHYNRLHIQQVIPGIGQEFTARTKRLRIGTKGGQRRSITSTHSPFRHSLTHIPFFPRHLGSFV